MAKIKTLQVQSQNNRTLDDGEIFISEIRGRYIVCQWTGGESVELEPYVDFDSEDEARTAVEAARAASQR